MKLIIVESPKKTVSISKILGPGHVVLGCGGHFMELKDGKDGFYGVDIENNFEPTFVPDSTKMKFISKIREQIKSSSIKKEDIYLATDDDREGEAISWHLANYFGLNLKTTKRMRFDSVTAAAIKNTMANPDHIDQNRVNSALARQVTDKVVGYELSPVLWRQIGRGLSAGRVQSVVTRMVVDLEKDIAKFTSRSYYLIQGTFRLTSLLAQTPTATNSNNEMLKATYENKPESYELARQTMELFKSIGPDNYEISNIISNQSQRNPSPPFITSSLQQECSNRFHWTPKVTMSLAQSLYEKGFITYMRTDSTLLSKEAFESAKTVIIQKYGNEFYKGKQYENKKDSSQEAHEAIRPTDLNVPNISGEAQEVKLYDLIWKRTIASQMMPEQVLTTTYTIRPIVADLTKKLGNFIHKHAKTVFQGFKIVYQPLKSEDDPDESQGSTLSYDKLVKGSKMSNNEIYASQEITQSEGRYTEASLIKKMEDEEIGRPSTFHSIVDKIQEKGYVIKKTISGASWQAKNLNLTWNKQLGNLMEQQIAKKLKTETNKLIPTDLGIIVTEFLEREFAEIMDYRFTASMEKELDIIRQGHKAWQDLVRSYWNVIQPKLTVLKQPNLTKERESRQKLLGLDPITKQEIYATVGRYGVCIRRDPNVVVPQNTPIIDKPLITLKPTIIVDKPLITLKPTIIVDKPLITLKPVITIKPTNITHKPVITIKPNATVPVKNPVKNSVKDAVKGKGGKGGKGEVKPEYWSIDKTSNLTLETITLDDALKIINTPKGPKSLGLHTDGKEIYLKNGKYGYYLEHNKITRSIKDTDAANITLQDAIQILTTDPTINKKAQTGNIKRKITGVGELLSGKFGPYLKLENGKNVNLKKYKVSEEQFLKMSDDEIKTLIMDK